MAEDQGAPPPPPLLTRRKGSAADRLFQNQGNFMSNLRQSSIEILSRSRSSSSSSNSSRASIAVVPQNMNLKQLNELLLKYIDQVGRGQKHAKLSPPLFSTDHYRCGILSLDKTCKDPSQSTWTGRLRLLIARPPFGREGIEEGMQS